MVLTLALVSSLAAAPSHPELGRVTWLRDFDAALQQAKATGKPVLVLFDEVPGCETVRGFAREVLSDDHTVALIERAFVPVVVFNNVDGRDRQVLESFGEPTWNNPVVRIIDADRRPLAPRFSGPYTRSALAQVLKAALEGRGATGRQTVTLAAACFWECEARLGRLDAVRSSRVGFLAGEEVVEVEFDPLRTSRQALLRDAEKLECANRVFTRSDAEQAEAAAVVGRRAVRTDEALRFSEKDTKYYLKRRERSEVGLTPLEAVRMNAALRFGEDPEAARSSCQLTK